MRVQEEVERAIAENRLDSGIDRLHTFLTLYLRLLVKRHSGSDPNTDTPLHSLMGTYIKAVQTHGAVRSEMTMRILKVSISTLEGFNPVRNNQSLAHPNDEIVAHEEARFIFSHIVSLVRLIESIESGLAKKRPVELSAKDPADLAF